MARIAICPSILDADFSCLGEEIRSVEKAGADGIHMDVMDGHFVPNISFGPVVILSVRQVTHLPFWSHLMIEEPDQYIPLFCKAGSNGIYIHPETGYNMEILSNQIHDLGMEAGIVLNPETTVDSVKSLLDRFERILVMTVHPGFGGQKFMNDMVSKITIIRRMTSSWGQRPLVEVDGGINLETTPRVVEAGADILVIGSAIFGAGDPGEALIKIREKSKHTKSLHF